GLAGPPGSTDGTGSDARFADPNGLAIDTADYIYVADRQNSTIRKISPAAVVTTLAGLAGCPSGSVDGVCSGGRFNNPYGIAVDASGYVYVADTSNSTIRKISSAGEVTTLAGSAGVFGSTDGMGTNARFFSPYAIETDSTGNLFVADSQTIRKITPAGSVT